MSVYLHNLFNHFEQLVEHPDDRDALDIVRIDCISSTVQVIDRLGQLLKNCQARASFKHQQTQELLQKVQKDLDGLEKASAPNLVSRIIAMRPRQNSLETSCSETRQVILKNLKDIRQNRTEFENWLVSIDARDSLKVEKYITALKADPKRLLLFFETAPNFVHWTLTNAETLTECYDQLARYAAERKISPKLAKSLAQLSKQFHLQQITRFKCVADSEIFYVDKILFALKSGPEFLEKALLGQAIHMPREISKQAFRQVVDYLKSGKLPDGDKTQFMESLDFLGIPFVDFLLDVSRQYRSCMVLQRLPGDKFRVSFKDPFKIQALQLLATRPCCWHIKEVDLSRCQVTDSLLQSVVASLPNVATLTLPYPNTLTKASWELLSRWDSLSKVILTMGYEKLQLFSLPDTDQPKRYELFLSTPFFPKQQELEAWKKKQPAHLVQFLCDYCQEPPKLDLLRHFSHLTSLNLSKFQYCAPHAYLAALPSTCPQLTHLNLAENSQLEDLAIQAYVTLSPQLIDIDLSGTDVSDATIEHLVNTCHNLRAIKLNECSHVTDNALKALARCKTLKQLHLNKCPGITAHAAQYFAKANSHSLWELTLPEALSNSDALYEISKAHPYLSKLRLAHARTIRDADVLHLTKNCRELVELGLAEGLLLTNESVRILANNCPWLEIVDLGQCPLITARLLGALLKNCPNMRELWLKGCSLISHDSYLANQFPHVKIYGPPPISGHPISASPIKQLIGNAHGFSQDRVKRVAAGVCIMLGSPISWVVGGLFQYLSNRDNHR